MCFLFLFRKTDGLLAHFFNYSFLFKKFVVILHGNLKRSQTY